MNITLDTVPTVFTYHSPNEQQVIRYLRIRDTARAYAEVILESVPESRERSLALTHLQEAVMWANVAIAINEA